MSLSRELLLRRGGILPYAPVVSAMRACAQAHHQRDQLWLLQHEPVYSTGVRATVSPDVGYAHIPLVHSDRGGLITYHGPGQCVLYCMVNARRRGVRWLVQALEQAMIQTLKPFGIEAKTLCGAPGVYVGDAKIGFIGLRISRGVSYHGLSLNVDMDLSPFAGIDSCGLGKPITQIKDINPQADFQAVEQSLAQHTATSLGYAGLTQGEPLVF